MIKEETIAAISTPIGSAGIGIIRISGEKAKSIAEKLVQRKTNTFESNKVYISNIFNSKKEKIDKAVVLYMKAPKSYTGEDVIEIQAHGGVYILQSILEEVINNGARLAEPGEFSKRAFLNGKIDLTQAEAVMDLIHSRSSYARKVAISQLDGQEKKEIQQIAGSILENVAYIETALDDPEHYDLNVYRKKLHRTLINIKGKIDKIISDSKKGSLIKEGIRTAIVGKTNAGKSTLLNALARKERAIVTDIEGTTRDSIEETVMLDNMILTLVDTAGIRETSDVIESIGIKKSYEAIKHADLILYVLDSTKELDDNDRKIIDKIDDKHTIVVLNKVDSKTLLGEEEIKKNIKAPIIEISAKKGIGIDKLIKQIEKRYIKSNAINDESIIVTNIRHIDLLKKSKKSVKLAIEAIDNGISEDFLTIDLMDAYNYLGNITGETTSEDLINEIFSKFCVGK